MLSFSTSYRDTVTFKGSCVPLAVSGSTHRYPLGNELQTVDLVASRIYKAIYHSSWSCLQMHSWFSTFIPFKKIMPDWWSINLFNFRHLFVSNFGWSCVRERQSEDLVLDAVFSVCIFFQWSIIAHSKLVGAWLTLLRCSLLAGKN